MASERRASMESDGIGTGKKRHQFTAETRIPDSGYIWGRRSWMVGGVFRKDHRGFISRKKNFRLGIRAAQSPDAKSQLRRKYKLIKRDYDVRK